jgi:hypothetical protein
MDQINPKKNSRKPLEFSMYQQKHIIQREFFIKPKEKQTRPK